MDMASSPTFSGHFPNNFKLVSFVCVISPPICFLRFLSFFFIFVSSSLPLFAFVSSWVFQLLRASISCLPYEVLLLFPSCLNTWSLLASYVSHLCFVNVVMHFTRCFPVFVSFCWYFWWCFFILVTWNIVWFLTCLVAYGCFCVLLLICCSQISTPFALFVVFPLMSWSTKKHPRGKFYFFFVLFFACFMAIFFLNLIFLMLFSVWQNSIRGKLCGSNAFQDYFDDAKESRVKQVSRIKIKIQDSRIIKIKIQESREDSIKISIKRVFQNIE